MHKRDFIKALLAGGAALLPAAASSGGSSAAEPARPQPPPLWPDSEHPSNYRSYAYHWTGWKAAQEHTYVVGQWLAWPLDVINGPYRADRSDREPYLYLNVPGCIGGVYQPGHVFAIGGRGRAVDLLDAQEIGLDAALAKRTAFITEGEGYIRQLIDAFAGHVLPGGWSPLFDFPLRRATMIEEQIRAALHETDV